MDAILRGAAVYLFLLLIFRIAGRRTLSELTNFDFILMLVIGESTQQALLANDFSVLNAFLVIITLIGIDILLAWLKQRSQTLDRWIEGEPTVILVDGRPLHDRMRRARVSDDDIEAAARELRGIGSMDKIQYAILERNGGISIIPKESARPD